MIMQTVGRVIGGLLIALIGIAALVMGVPTKDVAATPLFQSTPTPTPTPEARTPDWRSSQSSAIPRGLHRTAQVSAAGGGGWSPPDICRNIAVPAGSSAWAFSGGNQIFLDDPEHPVGVPLVLQAQECTASPDVMASATLETPSGRTMSLDFWPNPFIGAPEPGVFIHELSLSSEVGTYRMSIRSRGQFVSHAFQVLEGPANRIRIADARTGELSKRYEPGSNIEVTYQGIYNRYDNRVEVGLYRQEDTDELTLIDLWEIPEGNVVRDPVEILSLPPNAPEGGYVLMACRDQCIPAFTFATLNEPMLVYAWFDIQGSGTPSVDRAFLKAHVYDRIYASSVRNRYPLQAELFSANLIARIDEFNLASEGIGTESISNALLRPDVGDRINGIVHRVWDDWENLNVNHMSANPAQYGQSPFRALVIRLIQDRQGRLSDADQRALYSLLTRPESKAALEDARGVIGAVNREVYGQ